MRIDRLQLFAALIFAAALTVSAGAQTGKASKPASSKPAAPVPTPEPSPDPPKKNERPTDRNSAAKSGAAQGYLPTYFYEFERPGFITSTVFIEHDASGKGKISFKKKDFDELMTDPIQLSKATVDGINDALTRLDFLGSAENYQYEKDMPQMGNITIKFRSGERERTVKFNWTTNKDAKFLMDEYRRISNEYTWKFEMVTVRENQPLESPRMLDAFDSLLQRGEFTDPQHLVPFLKGLSDDERLPLIARNHAARLIKRLEKAKN